MCQLLNVSRSGYYEHITSVPSNRSLENAVLKELIIDIHEQFKGIYGYRRIKCELEARKIFVN
ncbi:IS3 family transposase [Wukongibacter sp. M2B1]|uniref:IS3 family transposase n=1 Tax=Wukongibacter sp. M2B1 TaxID=3088895 RepID=UPI003D793273